MNNVEITLDKLNPACKIGYRLSVIGYRLSVIGYRDACLLTYQHRNSYYTFIKSNKSGEYGPFVHGAWWGNFSAQKLFRGENIILSALNSIKRRFAMIRDGSKSPCDFALSCVDRFARKTFNANLYLYGHKCRRKFLERDKNCYRFKDVRLPLLRDNDEEFFFSYVFLDTFYSYMYKNDDYSEETFDYCDKILNEGLYGLVNDKVRVTVEIGDTVIDVGSWIGDFAAYAAVRGARVYAFEPSGKTFTDLLKTADMNSGIIPVKMALGSHEQVSKDIAKGVVNSGEDENFEITTIDEFVRDNNLLHVDFIKCDIEGNERFMLEGAQKTLRNFAPKLALCTYHLPDDPEVMASLILKANPKYNIVQKRMKLFASV